MTHREILEALSGLIVAMFVAILSGTIVTHALPRIVGDLHGSQTSYTWVLIANMLAMTATTPIWGKLADLFSKKMLVQIALVIYVSGSALCGLANSMEWLISARVFTGIGTGGIMALNQIIIGAVISPRERGRYAGYLGASFGLGTLLGPLIGGVIVDSPLGWRGCFYVGLPFAIIALLVLQTKLHLPVIKREVKIDYLGSLLIMTAVCLLLIWVSLGGTSFAWGSLTTVYMVGAAVITMAAAIYVEGRVAAQPVIPLHLFKDRTITLSVIGSVLIGIVMMSASTFLSQYFQDSRGMSPTKAGLMSLSMVIGMMGVSVYAGRRITATGRWKNWLVFGMAAATIGSGLLTQVDRSTALWAVSLFIFVLGCGIGATMQNLILAVQNNVDQANIGVGSSVVTFFRSLGGLIGLSALGTVLTQQTTSHLRASLTPQVLAGLSPSDRAAATGLLHGQVPDLSTLGAALRQMYEVSFGVATGHLFYFTVPCGVLALVTVFYIREKRLRTTLEDMQAPETEIELAAELEIGQLTRR